jgi:hypothetical protein
VEGAAMLDLLAEGRALWKASKQGSHGNLNCIVATSANPQLPQPPFVNNNNINHDHPLCGSSGFANYKQLSYQNFNYNPSLLDEYLDRFKLDGIDLLNDDIVWLRSICHGLPAERLRGLLDEYSIWWQEAMEKEPIEHKKQNAGRYNANVHFRLALK